MLADSSFLWLDSTAWTALGTLAALAIALGFLDWIRTWFRKPVLSFQVDKSEDHSSIINNIYWIRVPIYNKKSKRTAQNVEVFLESAAKISNGGSEIIKGFVPMRLRWSNTEAPWCDRIPPDSFRLLNIGFVELKGQAADEGESKIISFPTFTFAGEIHTEAHSPLALGGFELSLSITADDISPKPIKIRVIIRKPTEKQGRPAKIEIA